jgi:aryl-alcohol dehydrogenase-like predicted oxidoreductase
MQGFPGHRRRELGRSGVQVHAIGLGAMPLSIAARPDAGQALAVIRAYVDAGGDFIDTANAYCLDNTEIGHNERLIDQCLRQLGARDRVLVATKGGLTRPQGRWEVDGRPQWLRRSCEQSLLAIGAAQIDLYQLHAVDPKVPLADSVGELARLQQEGKIRLLGLSNVSATQLDQAMRLAEIVSVQNRCNPLEPRDLANGMVEHCRQLGVSYIPHSPVGGHTGHAQMVRHPKLAAIAASHGISVYCLALAWLLAKGDHILPIPGASRVESIVDSLRATEVSLDARDIAMIDAL